MRIGNPVDEILKASTEADVLVLDAHRSSGLSDRILGTTAGNGWYAVTPPGARHGEGTGEPYQHALVPVALGPSPAALLELAMLIAPRRRTSRSFTPLPSLMSHDCTSPVCMVKRLRDSEPRPGCRHSRRSTTSSPAPEPRPASSADRWSTACTSQPILRKAEELQVDLIVMGRAGESTLEKMLLSNVTRHIWRRPVVTFS